MPRMPASVVAAAALAVLVGLEALALMGFFAATASEHGPESAGVFIGGVLVMVHAGQLVAGARHRRASARSGAIRKALPAAALGAIAVAVGRNLEGGPLPPPIAAGIVLGVVVPLLAIALLLAGRAARGWFDAPE